MVAKNSTGCPFLDSKGVTAGQIYGGAEICLNCPYPECILTSRKDRTRSVSSSDKEVFVMCKTCGATETLTVRNGKLLPTQKWQQKGEKIYHIKDCGECK